MVKRDGHSMRLLKPMDRLQLYAQSSTQIPQLLRSILKYRKKCQFLHQIHSTSYNISSPPTLSSGAVPSCCPQIRLDTGEFLLRGNNSRAEEVGSRLMCYTDQPLWDIGSLSRGMSGIGTGTNTLVCILIFLGAFLPGEAFKDPNIMLSYFFVV